VIGEQVGGLGQRTQDQGRGDRRHGVAEYDRKCLSQHRRWADFLVHHSVSPVAVFALLSSCLGHGANVGKQEYPRVSEPPGRTLTLRPPPPVGKARKRSLDGRVF